MSASPRLPSAEPLTRSDSGNTDSRGPSPLPDESGAAGASPRRKKSKAERGPRKRRPRRRKPKDSERILERLLEQRPDAQSLVDKNILTAGALGTAPSLLARQLSLRRQQHQRQLDRFLRNRHSAQHLRELNILRGPDDTEDHGRQLSMVEAHLSEFLRRRPLPQQLRHSALFKDVLVWSEVPVPRGNTPVPRNCHTICAAPRSRRLFLFGGSCVDGLRPEVQVFSFATLRWTRVPATGKHPAARYAHTCTMWRNQLVVCGGYAGDAGWVNDVHTLDLDTCAWAAPEVRGAAPPPRAAHTATLVGDRLFVFGGNDARRLFNDVWILDLPTMEWSAPMVSGTPPSVRAGHSAVAHVGQIVVFGGGSGWGAAAHHNDLTVLDTDTMVWYRPSFEGSPPSPRMGHTACVLEGSMFVFGGGDARRVHNDLFTLDLETMVWSRPSDAGRLPSARAGHACCALGGQRALAVFGGADMEGTLFADLHVLELEGIRDSMDATAAASPRPTAETAAGGEEAAAPATDDAAAATEQPAGEGGGGCAGTPAAAAGAQPASTRVGIVRLLPGAAGAAGAAGAGVCAVAQSNDAGAGTCGDGVAAGEAAAAGDGATAQGNSTVDELAQAVAELRRTLRAQMDQHAEELRVVQEALRRTVETHRERQEAMVRQIDALEVALGTERAAGGRR